MKSPMIDSHVLYLLARAASAPLFLQSVPLTDAGPELQAEMCFARLEPAQFSSDSLSARETLVIAVAVHLRFGKHPQLQF